jgi:hypothetical protein
MVRIIKTIIMALVLCEYGLGGVIRGAGGRERKISVTKQSARNDIWIEEA